MENGCGKSKMSGDIAFSVCTLQRVLAGIGGNHFYDITEN
jgi:hypothetical protein